ncbi:hypothetical protein MRX96_033400 [Rhipicephalus microplus]
MRAQEEARFLCRPSSSVRRGERVRRILRGFSECCGRSRVILGTVCLPRLNQGPLGIRLSRVRGEGFNAAQGYKTRLGLGCRGRLEVVSSRELSIRTLTLVSNTIALRAGSKRLGIPRSTKHVRSRQFHEKLWVLEKSVKTKKKLGLPWSGLPSSLAVVLACSGPSGGGEGASSALDVDAIGTPVAFQDAA